MDAPRSRALTLTLAAIAFAASAALASIVAGEPAGLPQLATTTASVELFLLGIALGFAWASGRPPADVLGSRPGSLPAPALAALLVATLGASHALDGLMPLLDLQGHSTLRELARRLAGVSGLELLIALVALGLLPAFAEELLCRGLVQRALVRRFGAVVGIGSSSVLFGLLHGDPIHALLAAPLGLHLGLIAWWADSTRPAVLCHAGNNLAAVLLFALGGPNAPGWLQVALGTLAAAAGWRFALGRVPHRPGQSPLQPDPGTDDA